MRIIAGQFKGRILIVPKGSSTRPSQEIVRGAVFNICKNEIEGAEFLDLFAGSGAMGFEALSQGAHHITFVENNRNAITAIQKNIAHLQVASKTTLVSCDAAIALGRLKTSFDIIYLDPPYDVPAAPFVEKLIQNDLIRSNGVVFIEERKRQSAPPSFPSLKFIKSHRFGDAILHHYRVG